MSRAGRKGQNYARDEVLIELVKEHPCLYDPKNKDYKDSRGVKANVWKLITEDIVNKFGPDGAPTPSKYSSFNFLTDISVSTHFFIIIYYSFR